MPNFFQTVRLAGLIADVQLYHGRLKVLIIFNRVALWFYSERKQSGQAHRFPCPQFAFTP
jgi:hypothetical protein